MDCLKRNIGRRLVFVAFGIALIVAVVAACGPSMHSSSFYVYVTKKSIAVGSANTDPEITATARYKEIIPETRSIAYRPPDSCFDQSASAATGKASVQAQILTTSCGVWLAELERALARNGFEVTSWQTLIGNMGGAKISGDTVISRAKELGVEVLMMINSLDVGRVNLDSRYSTNIRFYESNKKGVRKDPLPLDPARQRALLAGIPGGAGVPYRAISATVDVTAIDLKTNQAVWFFRQTISEEVKREYAFEGLFLCMEQSYRGAPTSRTCNRRIPVGRKDIEQSMSEISTQGQSTGGAVNPDQNEKYKMIKGVVKNLSDEFARGRRQ